MPRTEAQNAFSEGLIMDLNPINMPNKALSDCLNGTIITYDGNEQSLQNDKGNYPLSNCKLDKGFIPVGLKEYGDILYIVSYNPIKDSVQIGSYPSPMGVVSSATGDDSKTITRLLSDREEGQTDVFYEDIVKESTIQIFKNGDDTKEKWKLHKGDKYKIDLTDVAAPYEDLSFYILDDDNNLSDITSYVSKDLARNEELHNVSWDVPGWLGIQQRVGSIDSYQVFTKYAKSPIYTSNNKNKLFLKLELRVVTSDPLFTSAAALEDKPFAVRYSLIGAEGDTSNHIKNLSYSRLNLNGTATYYDVIEVDSTLVSDFLEINSTPILRDYNLVYNKHDVKRYDVSNIGDISKFKIGEEKWRYYIDKDNNVATFTFDTKGFNESAVYNGDVTLRYTISHIVVTENEDNTKNISLVPVFDKEGNQYKNIIMEDWDTQSDSSIELPTIPYNESNIEQYGDNTGSTSFVLYPEDIYIVDFGIYESEDSTQPVASFRKVAILSEIMNSFDELNYENITFEEWVNNYIEKVQNGGVTVSSVELGELGEVSYKYVGMEDWLNPGCSFNFPTVISEDKFNSMSDKFSLLGDLNFGISAEFESHIKMLTGPIWTNIVANTNLTIGDVENTMNSVTGECNDIFESSNDAALTAENIYTLERETDQLRLFDYIEDPILTGGVKQVKGVGVRTKNAGRDDTLDVYIDFGGKLGSSSSEKLTPHKGYQNIHDFLTKNGYEIMICKVNCRFLKGGDGINGGNIYFFDGADSYVRSYDNPNLVMRAGQHSGVAKVDSSSEFDAYYMVYYSNATTKYETYNALPESCIWTRLPKDSESDAKSIYNSWLSSIERYKGISDIFSGAFYLASLYDTISGKDCNFDTSQLLATNLSTFNYLDLNLFSDSDKRTLCSALDITGKNLDNSKPNIKYNLKFESITSIPLEDIDDSPNKVAILTAYNNMENTMKTQPTTSGEVFQQNSKIRADIASYNTDKVMNSNFSPNEPIFWYKDTTPIGVKSDSLLEGFIYKRLPNQSSYLSFYKNIKHTRFQGNIWWTKTQGNQGDQEEEETGYYSGINNFGNLT